MSTPVKCQCFFLLSHIFVWEGDEGRLRLSLCCEIFTCLSPSPSPSATAAIDQSQRGAVIILNCFPLAFKEIKGQCVHEKRNQNVILCGSTM